MKILKDRKYKIWLAPGVAAVLAALTLIIAPSVLPMPTLTVIKVLATVPIAAILPILEALFKRELSIGVNILITSHAVLSIDLGSAFGFYSLVPFWDIFLHAYFGLVGAAALALLMELLLRNDESPLFRAIFLFLAVMGCAGLWEIFEFTTDAIFSADAQCVKEAIARGENPIADTMWDIIVTAVGAVIYLPSLFIKRRNS